MKKLLLVAFVFCSLLAYAQQETFESFKWNEVNHPLPDAQKLKYYTEGTAFTVTNGVSKMEVSLTTTGFNVKESTKSTSYLFANQPETKDVRFNFNFYFNYVPLNVNLQDDSTLVIGYNDDQGMYYIFTYKKGICKYLKKYALNKLDIFGISKAFYIDKENTYLYGLNTYKKNAYSSKKRLHNYYYKLQRARTI